MAALVIRTIDQETTNAGGAHLSEGDLLLASGHGGRAAIYALAATLQTPQWKSGPNWVWMTLKLPEMLWTAGA
jgi:hypothetical protein